MQNVKLTIESNIQVGKDIFLMKLVGDCTAIKNPGEFIEITIPGYYLRRPISVNDFSNNHVDILYKVLGHGTIPFSLYFFNKANIGAIPIPPPIKTGDLS